MTGMEWIAFGLGVLLFTAVGVFGWLLSRS
jgi:hypothetical protein